jgi:uncharacterized delta-60 repeat protein
MLKNLLSVVFSISFSAAAFAQGVGDLDPSFSNDGKYTEDFGFQDNLTDVKVQPDGKIIVAGTALNTAFSGQLLIKRINADGTSDNTFSDDGTVIINDYTESYAYECKILPDGKILVAGSIANEMYQFSLAVFKLNADGSFDTSFGVDGRSIISLVTGDTQVYDMEVDANGKIIVAGNMVTLGEYGKPMVCRLNADGTMDTTFANNGVATYDVTNDDNVFRNVAIDNDGRIVAAGHWGLGITGDGQINNDALVVRLLPDGSVDNTFGDAGKLIFPVHNSIDDLFGLEITSINEIYVCGYTIMPDATFDGLLAKVDEYGSLVASVGGDGIVEFNAGPQDVFADVILYEDQLYIGGSSGGFMFENRDFLLMRYELDGTIDESFGLSGLTLTTIFASFDDANALTIQADGKILLAGKGNNSTNNDIAVTRYLNDANVHVNEQGQLSYQLFPSLLKGGEWIHAQWTNGLFTECRVMNLNGQLVHQENIAPSARGLQVSTENWASGMYHVVMLNNGMPAASSKVIIH